MGVRNDGKAPKKVREPKISRTNLPNGSTISKYALNDNSTHRIAKFLQKGNIGTRVRLLSDKSMKQRKTYIVLYTNNYFMRNIAVK